MNKIIQQGNDIFKAAGFDYAICGGYGLDMFVGKEFRAHGDFDIVVYEEDKECVINFLIDNGWLIFGRFMEEGRVVTQHIFFKIDDITNSYWNDCQNVWAIKPECLPDVLHKLDRLQGLQGDIYTYQNRKWLVQDEIEFIELAFDGREGDDFVVQENPKITRAMDKAILYHDGIPYLAPEIILFYKTDRFSSEHPVVKIKTEKDFNTLMPTLSDESKKWLLDSIDKAYPDGYEWLDWLLK